MCCGLGIRNRTRTQPLRLSQLLCWHNLSLNAGKYITLTPTLTLPCTDIVIRRFKQGKTEKLSLGERYWLVSHLTKITQVIIIYKPDREKSKLNSTYYHIETSMHWLVSIMLCGYSIIDVYSNSDLSRFVVWDMHKHVNVSQANTINYIVTLYCTGTST